MDAKDIRVRPATLSDSRDLWLWRNDLQTRAMSKSQDEVSWEVHERWFAKTLADPAKAVFIGEMQGQAIGMCRFDQNPDRAECEVSINLNPAHRGQGLSPSLLAASIARYRRTYQGTFMAQIRHDNFASQHCFTRNGFILDSQAADLGRYRLPPQASQWI
ncbi:MAG: GNAT family N-acetyltransferase [Alphaproteobacteria bacterium]